MAWRGWSDGSPCSSKVLNHVGDYDLSGGCSEGPNHVATSAFNYSHHGESILRRCR